MIQKDKFKDKEEREENEALIKRIKETYCNVKNGWDVGAVNEDSLSWNDRTIDPKKFGTTTNIEICLYLTKEIEEGE